MNLENIIVCAICLVAIAIVGYFMYTKVTAQNQEMFKLSKRCEAIEMMFARPPPPDDLQAMYRPKYVAEKPVSDHPQQPHDQGSYEQPYDRPSPRSPPCESAMCDLEPLRIDTNEDELENIVNAELSKVIEEGKASPKRKRTTKSSARPCGATEATFGRSDRAAPPAELRSVRSPAAELRSAGRSLTE